MGLGGVRGIKHVKRTDNLDICLARNIAHVHTYCDEATIVDLILLL